MSLEKWNERLQNHFAALRDRRASRNPQPIFALEHGLGNTEISNLSDEIRLEIRHQGPSYTNWLPWVVYSAEIGYEYSGVEFWQTFANRTPGWALREDRHFIRSAFSKFHHEFLGARPNGKWASHFSIISWPIAHAILPQDLQLQLAEVLYDIRHIFTSELLRSPELLGQQIEAHSWNVSSRFQEFAEEHLLVGQIATALLLSEEEKESALILRSTLDRIAGDLDRNRRSRDWLRGAVRRATAVRLQGLERGLHHEDSLEEESPKFESGARHTILELGVEPRLVLRRMDQQIWDVRLQLPDLSKLLVKFPDLRNVLANERCTIIGSDARPLARGYFLYMTQGEVSLSSWPEPTQVLLKFDSSNPELDNLLTTECLLRPGPRWLFKILNDGSAIEVRTKTVRPGNSYIVLSAMGGHSEVVGPQLHLKCGGVIAQRLEIPTAMSSDNYTQLALLGFHTANGLSVAPVGLPPAAWDYEGYSEWLTTDTPVIAISADFQMPGLALNLVTGRSSSRIDIDAAEIMSPTIVELGQLDPGLHCLHVITASPDRNAPIVGTLKLLVRDSKSWKKDASASTSFVVLVSPANPSLELLWDDTASFDLLGPSGRKTDCEVLFFRSRSDQPFHRAKMSIDLPCPSSAWKQYFHGLKKDLQAQNAYNESDACEVRFRSDELGYFRFRCDRGGTPLRWVLREENRGYFLRLLQLDDKGLVSVSCYGFHNPETRIPLNADYVNGFRVPTSGALYVAIADQFCAAVVVPPPFIQNFAAFELKPNRIVHHRTETDVSSLLDVLELWADAQVTGDPISIDYKEQISALLNAELIVLLFGEFWAKLERNLSRSSNFLVDLKNEISTEVKFLGIGRELFNKQADFRCLNIREASDLLNQIAIEYLDFSTLNSAVTETSKYRWIIEFSLHLVTEPKTLKRWAGERTLEGLRCVLQHSIILRMCRFAALVCQSSVDGATISQMVAK